MGINLTNCIFSGVAGLQQHGILRRGAGRIGTWIGIGTGRIARIVALHGATTSANHEADERGT